MVDQYLGGKWDIVLKMLCRLRWPLYREVFEISEPVL